MKLEGYFLLLPAIGKFKTALPGTAERQKNRDKNQPHELHFPLQKNGSLAGRKSSSVKIQATVRFSSASLS